MRESEPHKNARHSKKIMLLPPRAKQNDARFRPNPGGRPRRERECAAILDEITPDVLRRMGWQAIKTGDTAAARIVINAALSPARTEIAQLDLGPMQNVKECQRAIAGISEAIGTGLIAPPDAAPFLALVAAASKQIEMSEIADRIARIEAMLAGKKPVESC